jgi:hypothetical protein
MSEHFFFEVCISILLKEMKLYYLTMKSMLNRFILNLFYNMYLYAINHK